MIVLHYKFWKKVKYYEEQAQAMQNQEVPV